MGWDGVGMALDIYSYASKVQQAKVTAQTHSSVWTINWLCAQNVDIILSILVGLGVRFEYLIWFPK